MVLEYNYWQGGQLCELQKLQNASIRDNYVLDGFYAGIQVSCRPGCEIVDNRFENMAPYPGYWGLCIEINEYGVDSEAVTITGNTCEYNTGVDEPVYAIRIRANGGDTTDASTFVIHSNNFLNAGARTDGYVVWQQGTVEDLDLTCNWWGTEDVDAIAAMIEPGYVTLFEPMLDGPYPDGVCVSCVEVAVTAKHGCVDLDKKKVKVLISSDEIDVATIDPLSLDLQGAPAEKAKLKKDGLEVSFKSGDFDVGGEYGEFHCVLVGMTTDGTEICGAIAVCGDDDDDE
jgi:hypothetical protein